MSLTSIRSWLQTADAAHSRQQSQLKLVAQSVERSLSSGPDIYTCVKSAWYKALTTLDKVVQGMPYDVQDPEVLLGLLAWHIYPDMNVVSGVSKLIEQNDPLVVPGGIITLGLRHTPTFGDRGITWSLPLSHLRYYGKAVISTGCIEEASSRVPFSSLLFVTLGCITRGWWRKGEDMKMLCTLFLELSKFFDGASSLIRRTPSWIKLLGHAAIRYLDTSGAEREDADRLVAWGRRRAMTFLGESKTNLPRLFNLSDRRMFTKTLKVLQPYSDSEQKIAWLRKNLTQEVVLDFSVEDALILYHQDPWKSFDLSQEEKAQHDNHNHNNHPDVHQIGRNKGIELTTLVTHPKDFLSRAETSKRHRRWICAFEQNRVLKLNVRTATSFSSRDTIPLSGYGSTDTKNGIAIQHIRSHSDYVYESYAVPGKASVLSPAALRVIRNANASETYGLYRECAFKIDTSGIISLSEHDFQPSSVVLTPERAPFTQNGYDRLIPPCQVLERERDDNSYGCSQKWYIDEYFTPPTLSDWFPWFGDHNHVAVYSKREKLSENTGSSGLPQGLDALESLTDSLPALQELTIDEILGSLRNDEVDRDALAIHLFSTNCFGQTSGATVRDLANELRALDTLYTAFQLYEGLSDALVDLRVTSHPLSKAKWAQENSSDAKAFACIAMFELGTVDINPVDLLGVTALSFGNSLYIAEYLLRDPYEVPKPAAITRTVGNIGRPGLAFLVSPKSLEIKKADYSTWKQINHAEFDGKIEKNFEETSFHLRFTGYESALNVRDHGLYDKEVYVLQAVIQAFDKGSWVADLDLVSLMTGPTEQRICKRLEDCSHMDVDTNREVFEPITSIDSWDELLDAPDNTYVVRAGGNWIARLAVAAVLAQQLKPFFLAPNKICWQCIRQQGMLSCIVIC
jgi:hypothetical protein